MPSKSKRAKKGGKKGKKKGSAGVRGLEQGATIGKVPKTMYGQFVPDVARAKLKYGLQGVQTTSTSFGISALSTNDVRDPGIALDNKSAIGFSGYMANYTNFYVLGSEIIIRCSHGSSATGIGSTAVNSVVGVFPSVGASAANDRASAEAQPGCKYVSFDLGGQKVVRQRVSCAELGGVTHQQYIADTTNWGTSSASPSTSVVLLWSFWNQSSCAQTSVDIYMDITVVYDVVFFRRRSLDITFDADLMKVILQREAREAKIRADPDRKQALSHAPAKTGTSKELKQETKDVEEVEYVEIAKLVQHDSSPGFSRVLLGKAQMPPTPGRKASTLK